VTVFTVKIDIIYIVSSIIFMRFFC